MSGTTVSRNKYEYVVITSSELVVIEMLKKAYRLGKSWNPISRA